MRGPQHTPDWLMAVVAVGVAAIAGFVLAVVLGAPELDLRTGPMIYGQGGVVSQGEGQ